MNRKTGGYQCLPNRVYVAEQRIHMKTSKRSYTLYANDTSYMSMMLYNISATLRITMALRKQLRFAYCIGAYVWQLRFAYCIGALRMAVTLYVWQ